MQLPQLCVLKNAVDFVLKNAVDLFELGSILLTEKVVPELCGYTK